MWPNSCLSIFVFIVIIIQNDVNIGEVKNEDLSAALEPTKEDDF